MSVFTVAYPDGRIGRGARNRFIERFGCVPEVDYRNRLQRRGNYMFMITKARDVPKAVEEGCLFGLTGLDFLEEYGSSDLCVVDDFGVCRSKVVSFESKDSDFKRSGKAVTVYPNIAKTYLQEKITNPDRWEIVKLSGETESWVASGLADIGIDVIETRETLNKTGLVVRDVIMESCAIIIAKKDNINKLRELYV